jgi:hypothetical protein
MGPVFAAAKPGNTNMPLPSIALMLMATTAPSPNRRSSVFSGLP